MAVVIEKDAILEIRMGDIYWANLRTAYIGESIQTGYRPIVVVSNDLNNKYSTTINVLPITSKLDKKPLPVHVEITKECGLGKPSIVLAEQISTIPKSCLGVKIGECTYESYDKIKKAMQIQNGEVFDICKAMKLIKAIKNADAMIVHYQLPKRINFRVALIDEYKEYCNKFGVDYLQLWNSNNNIKQEYKQVYA